MLSDLIRPQQKPSRAGESESKRDQVKGRSCPIMSYDVSVPLRLWIAMSAFSLVVDNHARAKMGDRKNGLMIQYNQSL